MKKKMIEKKSVIIDHFNQQVKDLHQNKTYKFGSENENYLLRHPYEHIEKIIKSHKFQKLKILDYCCGTGVFSIYPALEGHKVYGVDISNESIAIAKERAQYFNIKNNCSFYCMDSEKLEFEDNSFDLVLSYNSLTYLNLPQALGEINRVLRNKGKLIIMDSLGHNFLYNLNRNSNINRWGRGIRKDLQLLKMKDIKQFSKLFYQNEIVYFGFLTSFLFFLNKILNIKINKIILSSAFKIDKVIFKIPLFAFLAFKFVATLTSEKEKYEK